MALHLLVADGDGDVALNREEVSVAVEVTEELLEFAEILLQGESVAEVHVRFVCPYTSFCWRFVWNHFCCSSKYVCYLVSRLRTDFHMRANIHGQRKCITSWRTETRSIIFLLALCVLFHSVLCFRTGRYPTPISKREAYPGSFYKIETSFEKQSQVSFRRCVAPCVFSSPRDC